MNINPTDSVLHFSFDDEPFGRADQFCGVFNKRQVANKIYKPLEFTVARLPFKDKQFDVVYATNVLAYCLKPDKLFDEIKRIGRRCHLKERSEFAEMIFGWENTRWITDVEDKKLIIKNKNPLKCGRFGPLFHHLYATDPAFHSYCTENPGLLSIGVDWHEEDDPYEMVEEDVPIMPEVPTENIVLGEVKDPSTTVMPTEVKTEKQFVKKSTKTIFRPCQTEYFDSERFTLGEVSDKIDVRMLKSKMLQ